MCGNVICGVPIIFLYFLKLLNANHDSDTDISC